MNKIFRTLILLTICLASLSIQAQTSAQWRGLNRDGVYATEKNLLKAWPEAGPSMVWSTEEIGNGYGAPVAWSGKVFVNGEIDSISHLFAFDLQGKLVWKTALGKEFMGSGFSSKFPGARSAPTVVNDLVYVCSGRGKLACIETATGKIKWSRDIISEFKGILNEFGVAESILVDGDKLYCSPGGPDAYVVALNRFTGAIVWSSRSFEDSVSFCSPIVVHLAARSVLVSFSNYYIFGLDTKDGSLLWKQKQEKVQYQQQCNTPVFADGFIYYVAGDGNGAVKLELSADGKNIKEVWRNALVKNNFKGFVKLADHIFTTDRAQKIKCIDIKTGLVTDSIKIKDGSLISADGMLYVYSENGEVSLVKLTGTKMEIMGKLKIAKGSKEHFAHAAISDGRLYIRHGKALMAYDIKLK